MKPGAFNKDSRRKRKMKKLIGLVMTVAMLFVMQGALAEGEQLAPLYATVGEALEDSAEDRVVAGGVPGDYYAVVTKNAVSADRGGL